MKRLFLFLSTAILFPLMANAQKSDTLPHITWSMDTTKWTVSGSEVIMSTGVASLKKISWYPCEVTMWPLVFSETCPDNPMHCRHCGKEIKKGESFAYIVMEVKDRTKYIDWIHIRCALKRIK